MFVGLISLTACKKYDEGPLISLRSKEKRLCQKWKLYEAYIDEEQAEINYTEIDITKDGHYHLKYLVNNDTIKEEYNWQFTNNKNGIELSAQRYAYNFSYDSIQDVYNVDSVLYNFKGILQIDKLTQKEFWYHADTVFYNNPSIIHCKYKSND